ncbi:putative ATPase [Streptomyces venezuelae]|uniref:AAA family ATPase n=1 Tax=Streptomyces gardneri TaxID=66892 RepID=UPI000716C497|nr:ATP-binding protein [Streptomyces gardneri]ALO08577.1 putative ATPase [Streptomyces venezuelae]QPK45778.1 AAA family ATPase [Streptomyces gardneri]WRK37125.1 AAA family ATPase [Streptomyces venezuelae]
MLLRFRTANVRSLRDEQELSFVVSEGEPSAAARPIGLAGGETPGVLPLIGIFGANASGKSNVLAAMTDMRTAVLNSYAHWASHDMIPRHSFALDAKEEHEPSFFEADLVIEGVRWTYGFELGPTRVEAEWLHSYPRGHRQVWLDRDASRTEVYEWPGARVKDRLQLARRTRPNALLLSTAGTDNHPQLSPLFHWFRRNLWLINPEDERTERETFTTRELSGSRARRINELLRVADLGITGAEAVPEAKDRLTVKLTHRSATGDVAFDWRNESYGTRSWFALLGPLLLALDEGCVLLVDELDASLHPRFAAEVVRLFHDPDANPNGAQLAFTSHDPSVLTTPSGGRLLEPGQVWLTEKDKDGATELYPLTAASPGENEDLMRSYLAGAFGAVPALLEGQIARRLLAATHEAERT